MNIPELLQQLDIDALVELFEVDTTPIGGSDHFYFHAGTNNLFQPVVWQGVTYNPFPIEVDGFDLSTKGTLPRPHLRVANVSGILSAVVSAFDDLVGAKVIRRRTFARFLDGQPTADTGQHLDDDIFYVEQKVSETKNMVEFELTSAMDLQGVRLPSRIIMVNMCGSEYRSAECSYTGVQYFDVNNNPISSIAKDVCNKQPSGCKARFGERSVLPYGGFPASKAYKF